MEPIRPTERASTPGAPASFEIALLFSRRTAPPAWWERWLDDEINHVDLFIRGHDPGKALNDEDPEVWHLIESFGGRLKVLQAVRPQMEYVVDGWPGPVVWCYPGEPARAVPIGFQTCVTLAKAMIGCHNWLVQTPRQLLNWARHNGGLEIGSQSTEEVRGAEGA